MGNPPPHAAIRASVGMPANSDGSPWIKLKNSCVETPNRAVYALLCAISVVGIGAPSIRLKALRLPPSSRIATFSVNSKFSGSRHRCICHSLCQLIRDAVLLHYVCHWTPYELAQIGRAHV